MCTWLLIMCFWRQQPAIQLALLSQCRWVSPSSSQPFTARCTWRSARQSSRPTHRRIKGFRVRETEILQIPSRLVLLEPWSDCRLLRWGRTPVLAGKRQSYLPAYALARRGLGLWLLTDPWSNRRVRRALKNQAVSAGRFCWQTSATRGVLC